MNNSIVSISSEQKLVKTTHQSNKVVEVYFNPLNNSIQEVVYLPEDRIRVYDYSFEDYSSVNSIELDIN